MMTANCAKIVNYTCITLPTLMAQFGQKKSLDLVGGGCRQGLASAAGCRCATKQNF
jgi:hypothetical protein